MTPLFVPGDRVQCKAKNRRNGHVVYTFCNECENCKEKKYAQCTAEADKKGWSCASFRDQILGTTKRFRYENKELEKEDPLPLKTEEKVYDWSARDIRPLGTIQIDIPLIAPDDIEEETEHEEETDPATSNTSAEEGVVKGMFLDTYLGVSSKMERPV